MKSFASIPPALSMLALPGSGLAAEESQSAPDVLTSLAHMSLGLVAVLALIIAFVWLLKRFNVPGRSAGLLRVIGATAVGPRERVVLIEAGGKVVMIGVTPNNVRTLHVFGPGELPLATPVTACNTMTNFASRLRQALKGRRDED